MNGDWHKSSYSGASANCVECRAGEASVQVRDTQNRDLGLLALPRTEWVALVAGVRTDR